MNVTKKTNIEGRHLVDSCPKGTLVQGGHGVYLRRPFLVLLAFILAFSLMPLPASFAGESSSAASTQAEASASAAASFTAETQAETTSSSAQTSTPTEESSSSEAEEATSSTTETEGTSSAAEEESSSSESSESSEAADTEESEITAQSEAAYTVASFVGYKDMFTALAKTKIDGDKKTNQAALNLPTKLWVKLDADSLTAYKTDHAAEYAASETARTAHNDALSEGTPAEPTAADPYSNVTIPEDAVQVSVTKWTCRDNYEATDYDLYTFDPTLDEDFGLATGVDLPFLEVEVGEVKAGARTSFSESDWIALVNTYTASKGNAAYSDHFYEAVSFDGSGSGNLTWTDSGVAAADRWDGTADATCPVVGTTYSPTTPEQLLYALQQAAADTTATPFTIELPANGAIDLGGREHNLWPYIRVVSPLTINGNGCTLYNLYMCNDTTAWNNGTAGDHGTGLISDAYSLVVSNLDFDGTNLMGSFSSGSSNNNGVGALVGKIYSDASTATVDTITKVQVRNSLTIARGNGAGALLGRFSDGTGTPANAVRILEDCSSKNVVSMGGDHIGGLTGAIAFNGGLNYTTYVNRCYSVGTIVVSFGTTSNGHSGGLFSCLGGRDFGVSNCFVDAQVYGQSRTGVFSGAGNGTQRVAFMNCFSSGFVDGESELGGFIGAVDSPAQSYFFDCYSTALVGVNNSGPNMGGFVGYAGNADGGSSQPISGFSNCYAAGEVGNAATNSAGATPGQTTAIGGFLGSTRLKQAYTNKTALNSLTVIANCFYDKQTTGMREYDVGNRACLCLDTVHSTGGTGDNNLYLTGIMKTSQYDQGLQGCLTTSTTDKSGAGLTSSGGLGVNISTGGTTVDVGFTGMRDDKACMGTYPVSTAKGWNDSTVAAQAAYGWDTTAEGHYPELVAFRDNKAGFSAEDAAIAAAYSKSSTSTAMLETWEKGLDPATGNTEGTALDATTYDTVRDITIRFDLTKDATNWTTTGTQDGAAGTHATSTIKGVTKNVLALLDDGSPYADQFTPGMEWLQVTATASGQDATRRFRVTPSASLDAGESKNVYETTTNLSALYDHANDVEFYYTTASRWATNNNDVTTGVYPDTSPSGTTFPAGEGRTPDAITSSQTNFANSAADSLFDSFFGTGGTDTNDHYGVVVGNDNNKSYPGVDMSYMARDYNQNIDADTTGATNSAKGSKVFTYIRPIEYFDASDNNKIITGDMLDLTVQENSDSFNGYKAFQSENTQYLVEYVWELADGRIVRDAKIVTIKSVPFDVNIDVYESGAIDSTVAAQKDALHDSDDALVGVVSGVTDVANDVVFPNTVSNATEHSVKAGVGVKTVAGWTVTNPLKQVNKIKIDFIFEPKIEGGQAQHYSTVLEDPKAGDKITVPYKFWRIVTLSNGDYYSIPINLDREYEVGEETVNGVTYQYLFFDLDKTDEETGIKVLDMEDDAQVDVELSEVLMLHKSIEGDYADKTKAFDFDIYYTDAAARADAATHKGKTYTYQVWDDNGTPDNYSDDVKVTSGGNPVTGTITAYDDSYATKSGTVQLTDNQYISVQGGTEGDTYRFVEAGVTDYTTTVSAEDGTLVGKTPTTTVHDQWSHNSDVLPEATESDTGTLALPALSKATTDAEGNATYEFVPADYSRTNYVNTYKEVVPSAVSSEAQWPWLLLVAALALAAAGGGYALYRKRRGEGLFQAR